MDAILKAFSTVRSENRRNKVLTVIKHLTMREYSSVYGYTTVFITMISGPEVLSELSLLQGINTLLDKELRGAVVE